MTKDIKLEQSQISREEEDYQLAKNFISKAEIKEIKEFHQSFKEYEMTPIHDLKNLATEMGVEKIWVKDESYRFGLNAFKVLGGSYAIVKYLSQKLEIAISELSFEKLKSKEIKKELGDITFVTATDGNHGRGVAWAAENLGQKSVVFMPKGSAKTRLENIKKEGAQAEITDVNYDDTVRIAKEYAKNNNGVIVQDTAWEGYQDIPKWIMQGYITVMVEIMEEQLIEKPTHIILQAGVGAFAGSLQGYLTSLWEDERPQTIIVEPQKADCIYQSAKNKDGKVSNVKGDLDTIMAGLACGEPNPIAWQLLYNYADSYISAADYIAAQGMRILANPLGDDPRIISGESGAVGIGLIDSLVRDESYKSYLQQLEINQDAKILVISTEGDTDPKGYKDVVWDGKYPLPE